MMLDHFSSLAELPAPWHPVRALKRVDSPNRDQWLIAVEKALAEIQAHRLEKVVLARETVLHLSEAPDPFQMTASLKKKAQGASLFCIQFDANRALLGATPERLFQRIDQTITAEAIAGTRKRGLALETELLSSEKDRREFQFVQDYFEEMLKPHCTRPLQFSPIDLHRTANVQHLISRATGDLLPHRSDHCIVQMLHPSPALCGTPKQAALQWICNEEPFQRGLYGGIIGWQTARESDWVVAIRSCILEGRVARIYTGTGIVAGSDPQAEWDELEAKLALYEEIFPCGL